MNFFWAKNCSCEFQILRKGSVHTKSRQVCDKSPTENEWCAVIAALDAAYARLPEKDLILNLKVHNFQSQKLSVVPKKKKKNSAQMIISHPW